MPQQWLLRHFLLYPLNGEHAVLHRKGHLPAGKGKPVALFAVLLVAGARIGLQQALQLAADYTAECIRITAADPEGIRYGVYFEALIPQLLQQLG